MINYKIIADYNSQVCKIKEKSQQTCEQNL